MYEEIKHRAMECALQFQDQKYTANVFYECYLDYIKNLKQEEKVIEEERFQYILNMYSRESYMKHAFCFFFMDMKKTSLEEFKKLLPGTDPFFVLQVAYARGIKVEWEDFVKEIS